TPERIAPAVRTMPVNGWVSSGDGMVGFSCWVYSKYRMQIYSFLSEKKFPDENASFFSPCDWVARLSIFALKTEKGVIVSLPFQVNMLC
ncbi:hypothetical protein LJB87_02525, partial [Alistipes sp. OttesenSCG-928-L06]|nr:hypothetical protein [Alistipes sp. OttesenSCG-928-L06]